ncbi:cysteine-rich secretory protein LCCL domain-containing 1-like [Oncorhynchus keta]|uniref:cysteine-rich secretory protein LCCL domain-containing 1-like n=1 Tax=Oncorhynchus keta TaxID=8018 RepID=UPI00227C9C35|nr:cysteine-rich secretory protein LCCL domain-containing 1-like [Oncorhynchus keta]
MQSSICRAGLHSGVLDTDGGWLDVTRQGRKDFFIKSNKNGIQSLGKYQSANSFIVSRVAVKAITCETTVAQMCSYQKLVSTAQGYIAPGTAWRRTLTYHGSSEPESIQMSVENLVRS